MRGVAAIVLAVAGVLAGALDAHARIGPGVVMDGCTTNFVFRDANDLYLGFAAHCVEDLQGAVNEPTEPVEQHECAAPTYPPGTEIEIEGASVPGRLAYSSWHTMRAVKESDRYVCNNNDFAIVRIDPRDHAAVDPTVPFWGGPTGLRREPIQTGETAVSFGRSDLRADIEPLMPREGYFATTYYDGWTHTAWFLTMAVFGDSGSAVLDGAGGAAGVMVSIEFDPPGTNGVTDLGKALEYMRSHGGPDVRLVPGTKPFTGARIPTLVESPPSEPEPMPAPPPPAPEQPAPAQPAPAQPAPAQPAPQKASPKPKAKRKPARRCRKLRGRRKAKCRRAHGRRR